MTLPCCVTRHDLEVRAEHGVHRVGFHRCRCQARSRHDELFPFGPMTSWMLFTPESGARGQVLSVLLPPPSHWNRAESKGDALLASNWSIGSPELALTIAVPSFGSEL